MRWRWTRDHAVLLDSFLCPHHGRKDGHKEEQETHSLFPPQLGPSHSDTPFTTTLRLMSYVLMMPAKEKHKLASSGHTMAAVEVVECVHFL